MKFSETNGLEFSDGILDSVKRIWRVAEKRAGLFA
jgi:hypothetical protein